MGTGPRGRADDLCGVCGQSRFWHSTHHPRHKFVARGEEMVLEEVGADASGAPSDAAPALGGEPPTRRMPPADLVLRAALIRAGVISNDDLLQMEFALQVGGEVLIQQGGSSDRSGDEPLVHPNPTSPG